MLYKIVVWKGGLPIPFGYNSRRSAWLMTTMCACGSTQRAVHMSADSSTSLNLTAWSLSIILKKSAWKKTHCYNYEDQEFTWRLGKNRHLFWEKYQTRNYSVWPKMLTIWIFNQVVYNRVGSTKLQNLNMFRCPWWLIFSALFYVQSWKFSIKLYFHAAINGNVHSHMTS